MTNEEFKLKYRNELCGLGLTGLVGDTKGAISRTILALEIPDLVDGLMDRLYRDLCTPPLLPQPEAKRPTVNPPPVAAPPQTGRR